jgi:type I restriction enzyme R subunit
VPSEPSAVLTTADFDPTKRIYVATLQTMQDFHSEFSPAAFDFIVSDECHRSIYDRWEPVINYFDALLLGLTATPADYIARNTFQFFGCQSGVPTFGYELEQAVAEGYLVPFEAYHARTTIQISGIKGTELSPEVRKRLEEEGIDPEDLDFAGSELERRVTNKETTRLLVREFFDQSVTDPGGSLPGKSIVFAVSHAHARRIWETLNSEFPQFPGLAEIIDSHMEDPDSLIRRFKTEDMPRIAISVDMLDTGIDVPTVVNLGFMKPVFSRIKFWQMIGRGTRIVDDHSEREWCPTGAKDSFRVLDFWENFERFQINPEGSTPSQATPVATKRFRLLLTAHRILQTKSAAIARDCLTQARAMIAVLPLEAAGIREHRLLIERITQDQYWLQLDEKKYQVLSLEVAPIFRYMSGVDLPGTTYANQVLELLIALGEDNSQLAQRRAESVREAVASLPPAHPAVAPYAATVTRALSGSLDLASIESVFELLSLADVMRHRVRDPSTVITLDIDDAFQEQRWLTVGPHADEFDLEEYRVAVENRLRDLSLSHPAMLKISTGQLLTDADIAAIEATLNEPDLFITEESLKRVYDAPHGSLVALIRHALGVETLAPRQDAVKAAFEAFIQAKGYLRAEEILFVRLFAARLAEAGHIVEADLYEQPFTLLAADPSKALPEDDLSALFELAAPFESLHA